MPTSAPSRTRATALAFAVTGLATSALLWVRAANGGSGCGLSGGCDLVQASAWSSVLGIPLYVWGTVYFVVVVGGLLHGARPRWPRWLRGLTVTGGLGGAGLLALQAFSIGAWCPWCLCVDLAAIGLAVLALIGAPLSVQRRHRPLAFAAGVVAVGVAPPLLVDLSIEGGEAQTELAVPDLAQFEEPTADGVARIVEFVDVECPFCREQHARLAELLDGLGRDRVEVEVHHVPIPRHQHAAYAAAVATCCEAQDKGASALDRLMRADDLSPAGCRRAAAEAGVDLDALDACLRSDVPTERLAADREAATAVGLRSLPTCVIGGQRFEGLQSSETLRGAIESALERGEPGSDCST